jgi:hypothetical protein
VTGSSSILGESFFPEPLTDRLSLLSTRRHGIRAVTSRALHAASRPRITTSRTLHHGADAGLHIFKRHWYLELESLNLNAKHHSFPKACTYKRLRKTIGLLPMQLMTDKSALTQSVEDVISSCRHTHVSGPILSFWRHLS